MKGSSREELQSPAPLSQATGAGEGEAAAPAAAGVRFRSREALPARTVKQVAAGDKVDFARDQRRAATQMEDRLWGLLRGQRLGFKFRRQHPIGDFILDFYCSQAKLGVEIDGPDHKRQTRYDEWRTEQLAQMGLSVLRFPEEQVRAAPAAVLTIIRHTCRQHADERT